MRRQPAARRFAAVPIVPIIGAFLAKKAVASYAIFNAVHSYGIPKLLSHDKSASATRRVGRGRRGAARVPMYLVKRGAPRADQPPTPSSTTPFAARAWWPHVAQNLEPRAERPDKRALPPVIAEALPGASSGGRPWGRALDAALGVLDEAVRPKVVNQIMRCK